MGKMNFCFKNPDMIAKLSYKTAINVGICVVKTSICAKRIWEV
jgi:hypothetical protein